MTDNLEVKTTLKVDAGASESVIGGLKKSFESASQAREAAQVGMGFFGQTLSTMAGMYLPQAIHKVYEYGNSFIEATNANNAHVAAMTGLISTMQNIPWDKAKKESVELNEHLNQMALDTHKNAEDIKDAFQVMTEIGGATPANLERSTNAITQMAGVSKVLGMSTGALAREYQFMGEGILRTRGMLFQMLQTTGIFGDKTKGAAAEWAKLTESQRAERLDYAMGKLSAKMGAAPAGFGALIQDMHTMEDIAKEQLGTPILQALVPQLQRVVAWMKEGRGSIEDFAKHMADDVKRYAEEAGRIAREGWEYIKQHSEEIKNDIITAWSFAQRVIQFAIEHKEALVIAYGAKAALGSAPVQGAIGAGKAIYGLGSGGTAIGGASMAGAAGGAAALGAFALAMGGVALAAWQATKLMNDLDNDQKADVRARYEYFRSMSQNAKNDFAAWDEAATAHFDHAKQKFIAESNLLGMSRGEADQMASAVQEQHEANRKMVEYAEDAAKRYQAAAAAQGGMVDVKDQDQMIAVITKQFVAAQEVSNTGAEQYIATLLAKSKDLQSAFLQSADMTSEGYKLLSEMTQNSAGDFSEALKRLGDAAAKREKTTAKVPHVQFNGGQTFKIQQDFRDENPDRIAMVFQRDILRSAERRLQSSNASPFGS